MLFFHLITFCYIVPTEIVQEQQNALRTYELPSWISTNPAYLNPSVIDSTVLGFGSVSTNISQNVGWVVRVNNEAGYGIDVFVDELHLGSDNGDYIIVAGWPISTSEFKIFKIFTGTFTSAQRVRILNTKSFFVLFNGGQSNISSRLTFSYKRYGQKWGRPSRNLIDREQCGNLLPPVGDGRCTRQTPLPLVKSVKDKAPCWYLPGNPFASLLPTTAKPVVKDTVFEVYLKGRKPEDYSDEAFLYNMKKAVRLIAKAYCQSKRIQFNDSISTHDMVLFHKISFCPYEWPDRDICAIIEHSVFVSGEKSPNDMITIDYELTSEHLQNMWLTSELSEIHELGIVVFKLPEATGVITLWVVGIGVVTVSSLVMISVFWKIERKLKNTKEHQCGPDSLQVVKLKKKHKFKSARSQQIPKFMLQTNAPNNLKLEGSILKTFENDEEESSTQQPLKNYIGSILFFSNEAFEEDDEILETVT